MKISENSISERHMKKIKTANKINTLCSYLSELIKADYSEIQEDILSCLQLLDNALENANKELYNCGIIDDITKESIGKYFNKISKELDYDYKALFLFANVINELESGSEVVDGNNIELRDPFLVVRFCEVTNKLARVLLETASLKPMLSTLTSAKLLADRLFKISGEISSRGYFNKMLMEVSDEDSVYRACLDIFKDADNQIVMEACRDFKKVVEEIRKKLNEGC